MPTDPPPPKRRRLWLWLGVVPASLILALLAGIAALLTVSVDRRLAAAIAAADRDDPNWRLDDMLAHREAVPDAENSARIATEAMKGLPEEWPKAPKPPGQPDPSRPEVALAYDWIDEAPINVILEDEAIAPIRSALAEMSESVRLARTIAEYPRGYHKLAKAPTHLDILLTETAHARTLSRLLRADAAIRAQAGDVDGSLDSCRAIVCVGRSIGDEPTLVSQLIRSAIGVVALQAIRRTLAQGEPADATMARLQALLDDERSQPLLLNGLKGERAGPDDTIRRLGTGEVHISDLSGTPAWAARGRPRARVWPWGKLMFASQRAILLEWMNDAIDIAKRPDFDQPPYWTAWESRLAGLKKSWHGRYTGTLPLLFATNLPSLCLRLTRYRAEVGSTIVLLAAERHRRRTGAWPASAAEISRDLLPSVPTDPFSGEPIRLEYRDGQLFAYSVGYNRKDDHGAYDAKHWQDGPFDVGTSAWDVGLRRRPAPRELPENVFKAEPAR